MTDPLAQILTEAELNRRAERAASTSAGTVSTPASIGNDTVQTTPSGTAGGNVVTLDETGRIPAGLIPAGAGGGGTNTVYEHVQSTPSAVWTIPHMLGGEPSVRIKIGGRQVNTTVLYPDVNHVVIQFGRPYAGTADLSL